MLATIIGTQLLQRPFPSSEFSPIMPEEFEKHLKRDKRPFSSLKKYLQILQIHSSMLVLLLFGSPHTFSVGFNNCGQHSLEKDIYLIMKEVGRVEVAWAYCVFCLCVRVCVRVTLT